VQLLLQCDEPFTCQINRFPSSVDGHTTLPPDVKTKRIAIIRRSNGG
jgi:hypothetical protein